VTKIILGVLIFIWAGFSALNAEEAMHFVNEKWFNGQNFEATPKATFPNRRIGYLKEGHKANFIVLQNNPLVNLENI